MLIDILKTAGFFIGEFSFLILIIKQSKRVLENRFKYPVKQLSPLMTIILGFSFYICQLTLLSLRIFFSSFEVELTFINIPKCEVISNPEGGSQNIYLFLGFTYILSTGFCCSLLIWKSYRVLIGFSRQKIYAIGVILGKEYFVLLLALMNGTSFLAGDIVTLIFHNLDFSCLLQVHYESYGGVKSAFWVTEIQMLIGIFIVHSSRINDKLVNLTLGMQILYVVWFCLNALFEKKYPLLVQISCLMRIAVMLYGVMFIPCQLKVDNPTLHITTEKISRFKFIFRKQFHAFYTDGNRCYTIFQKYLRHLDLTHEGVKFQNGEGMKFYDFFQLFEKIQEMIDNGDQYDNLYQLIQRNSKINNAFKGQTIYEITEVMFLFFENLYEKQFTRTKAYMHLYKFYYSNLQVQHNFQMLNIPFDKVEMPNFNPNENRETLNQLCLKTII